MVSFLKRLHVHIFFLCQSLGFLDDVFRVFHFLFTFARVQVISRNFSFRLHILLQLSHTLCVKRTTIKSPDEPQVFLFYHQLFQLRSNSNNETKRKKSRKEKGKRSTQIWCGHGLAQALGLYWSHFWLAVSLEQRVVHQMFW